MTLRATGLYTMCCLQKLPSIMAHRTASGISRMHWGSHATDVGSGTGTSMRRRLHARRTCSRCRVRVRQAKP
eukprot:scaffold72837_cov20-Prasinocladus_malaysianus.AAC.1